MKSFVLSSNFLLPNASGRRFLVKLGRKSKWNQSQIGSDFIQNPWILGSGDPKIKDFRSKSGFWGSTDPKIGILRVSDPKIRDFGSLRRQNPWFWPPGPSKTQILRILDPKSMILDPKWPNFDPKLGPISGPKSDRVCDGHPRQIRLFDNFCPIFWSKNRSKMGPRNPKLSKNEKFCYFLHFFRTFARLKSLISTLSKV